VEFKEPGEWATIFLHLIGIESFGFFLVFSGPVILGNRVTPDLFRIFLIENGVFLQISPALVPVFTVTLDPCVLEEESIIAGLAREELGLKLDLCDFDMEAPVSLWRN